MMKAIALSERGKNKGKYVALIDDLDFDKVSKYKWRIHKKDHLLYAIAQIDGKRTKMHNFILGKKWIDHKDGNGLNNQRSNLRQASISQNNSNRRAKKNGTSIYLGVTASQGYFRVAISHKNKQHYIGCFKDEIEAAKAYDNKAKEFHGDFANLNFK